MSTQSIPHVAPRFRIGTRTVLTAVALLVAIAATITILALTANHTTAASPARASHTASGSTPQAHYLGPRREQTTLNPQISATAGNPAGHYSCLQAAQRCVR